MAIYFFVFLLGAIIGSFLNVCIYRLPRELSLIHPSSHCPSCGKPVRFYDNIPIISYFILRGKCRSCKRPFSFRYPFVEALNGMLYVLIVVKFSFVWLNIFYFVFISIMVVIFFIDLDHQIIPDKITLPGIPLCFILAGTFLPDPFFRDKPLGLPGAYIGMASGCFFFFTIALYGSYILKKEAIGFGDIKFMTMIGSVLGWKGVFLTTFTASLLGVLIGVPLVVVQKKSETARKIPFGPFLAIGASICLFFGQEILQFYVQMIY